MTISSVINHFTKEYERAKRNTFVYKPYSYALYQTWRWCDKVEKTRGRMNSDENVEK